MYFLIGCINGLVCFLMFSHLANISLSLSLSPVESSDLISLFSDCFLAALAFFVLFSSFSFFLFKFCSIFCLTSTRVKEETGPFPETKSQDKRYVIQQTTTSNLHEPVTYPYNYPIHNYSVSDHQAMRKDQVIT